MTIEARKKKLDCLITCMKCETSGKSCDENCDTQYAAGNMGEIIENLEAISDLLNSEEKTGHWVYVQYDGKNIGDWHCSECDRIVCGAITAVSPVYTYKYCPECGAKMEK